MCSDEQIVTNGEQPVAGSEDMEARLDWVRSIAGRLIKRLGLPTSEYDELVSAGYLGYVEAAGRYDPDSGKKFEHYAVLRVRGAIIDAIRKNCHLSGRAYRYMKALEAVQDMRESEQESQTNTAEENVPLARALSMVSQGALTYQLSMDEARESGYEPASEDMNAEELLEEKQTGMHLRDKVKELDEEEQQVVAGYYFEEKSFVSIAESLGVSKSWVSKVHRRALQKLGMRLSKECCT